MSTIQSLAKIALASMEIRETERGINQDYGRTTAVFIKEDAPEWVNDMCYHAHRDMMPDHWRFGMIYSALSFLADAPSDIDPDSLRESLDEAVDYEVSIYNHALIAWLSSHSIRSEYVDEAIIELGYPGDLMKALQYGQAREIAETYGLVSEFIANMIEEEEEETE